jgi:hypothetical protein
LAVPELTRSAGIKLNKRQSLKLLAWPLSRAALNWTVRDRAAATGLHRNTITNIEVGGYVGDPPTLTPIKDELAREGVQFIDENGGGAGVRLRKSGELKPKKK